VYVYFRPLVGYSRVCRVRMKINMIFWSEKVRDFCITKTQLQSACIALSTNRINTPSLAPSRLLPLPFR